MKIAIVVHGRFHAFDLARALIQRGHDVTLLTNYPKWAVERFGVSRDKVRSFWVHGVISRIAFFLQNKLSAPVPEALLHMMFGRWAAKEIGKETWDVVHRWSGIAEEGLRLLSCHKSLNLVVRGSAHIRTQARILEEERQRAGTAVETPSKWMIAREMREYDLADRVVVLSSFAYESFVSEGVHIDRLQLLRLGAQTEAFRPPLEVVQARYQRIMSGQPLRILYIGTLSFQKGLLDMATVLHELKTEGFNFRFVGPVTTEVRSLVVKLQPLAEFIPKQPQQELPMSYAWGDLFVFPTLQDGFAAVLAQANASALPILTTTNCTGPDMIREGDSGWVLPIRNPEAFIERLRWCDTHREEVAAMARRIYHDFRPRDWSDVAKDFEKFCEVELEKKKRTQKRDGETAGVSLTT